MKRLLIATALIALAMPAMAVDTIKAKVGHMCCGKCKSAATEGVKTVAWADTVAIDADTLTIAAKAGQKIELVSLMDALNKAGFPAMEIQSTGPVTLTLGHLCCGNCSTDLKAKIANIRSKALDKDNVKIDLASKTLTIQPAAGETLNLVPLLTQLQRAGFSASSCLLSGGAKTASAH